MIQLLHCSTIFTTQDWLKMPETLTALNLTKSSSKICSNKCQIAFKDFFHAWISIYATIIDKGDEKESARETKRVYEL